MRQMSLPSMGSLSHPARVMLGTEGKSAKSRNSEDDHHRKFEDYREVAFGVKGPRVTLTLGQVADMALGLEEITSHRPLSVLLRSAVQVKFQHTPHKQLVYPLCRWLKSMPATLLGKTTSSTLSTLMLIIAALTQADSMTLRITKCQETYHLKNRSISTSSKKSPCNYGQPSLTM